MATRDAPSVAAQVDGESRAPSSAEGSSSKNTDSVEDMMRNMKLTAAEAGRLVDDDEEDLEKPCWAIAGKILAPELKTFHINAISDAMRPAWGNPKGLVFRSGGKNLFIAELGSERDRERIWERSPWTVSKFAVVMENFDSRSRPSELKFDRLLIWVRVLDLPYNKLNDSWGKRIASKIGGFVRLDVNKDGLVSAQYLHARVFINVNNPIMRWVGLDSKRLDKTFWYDIQYEFLPYFCFSCGVLGHSETRCPTPAERNVDGILPWGPHLRAPNEKKKSRGPPFAEGGYEEYPNYFENDDGKKKGKEPRENEESDLQDNQRNENSGGRGRGRGKNLFGIGGGKPQVYYRRLNNSTTGPGKNENINIIGDAKLIRWLTTLLSLVAYRCSTAVARIAVVTGGNKGMGLEVCKQLAGSGITVVLTARDDTRGTAAVEQIKQLGHCDVIFHQLDITDASSIARLADFLKTRFGKLDILVNNAGTAGFEHFDGMDAYQKIELIRTTSRETYETAKQAVQTNYYATKQVTEALLPLLQSSSDGRIVNVSSKFGLLSLFKNEELKLELNDIDRLTEERLDELLDMFLKDFEAGAVDTRGWPAEFSAYKVAKAALNAYLSYMLLNAYLRILVKRHPELHVKISHSGEVAVVTGGSKGIGLEVCKQLAGSGITVVLTARDETRGTAAVEQIKQLGHPDAIFHQLDITDASSIARLADFLRSRFGKLDILVNNAATDGVEHVIHPVNNAAYSRIRAKRHPDLRINCAHPGYVRTDITRNSGIMTPEEGARNITTVVLLPEDGPTGAYFHEGPQASFV
ncbi:hypothetical protein ACQ4PT_016299 [Festuca glaucescens]